MDMSILRNLKILRFWPENFDFSLINKYVTEIASSVVSDRSQNLLKNGQFQGNSGANSVFQLNIC